MPLPLTTREINPSPIPRCLGFHVVRECISEAVKGVTANVRYASVALAILALTGTVYGADQTVERVVFKTGNTSLDDLPLQMAQRYQSLARLGQLRVRVITDDIGLPVRHVIYGLGLLRTREGKDTIPEDLSTLLCRLNKPTCKLDLAGNKPVATWTNARGSRICVPDVTWAESIRFSALTDNVPTNLIEVVTNVYGGCDLSHPDICDARLRGLNRWKVGDLKDIHQPVVVPVLSMTELSQGMVATPDDTRCRFDGPAPSLSEALDSDGWSRLERLNPWLIRNVVRSPHALIEERSSTTRHTISAVARIDRSPRIAEAAGSERIAADQPAATPAMERAAAVTPARADRVAFDRSTMRPPRFPESGAAKAAAPEPAPPRPEAPSPLPRPAAAPTPPAPTPTEPSTDVDIAIAPAPVGPTPIQVPDSPWTLVPPAAALRPNVLVVDWKVDTRHCLVCGLFKACSQPPASACGSRNDAADALAKLFELHGSHVVGLIGGLHVGVNSRALVDPVELPSADAALDPQVVDRVERKFGEASEEGRSYDVVNLSLNVGQPSAQDAKAFQDAINTHLSTLFVAAAGDSNEPLDQNCTVFPACFVAPKKNLLVVGGFAGEPGSESVWWADNKRGSAVGARRVHVLAPADTIVSATVADRIGVLSGTSQSAAIVSGVASMVFMVSPFQATPEMVANRLQISARITADSLRVSRSGYLDPAAAIDIKLQRFTYLDNGTPREIHGIFEGFYTPDGATFLGDTENSALSFLLPPATPNANLGPSVPFRQIHRLVRVAGNGRYAVWWMQRNTARYTNIVQWRDVGLAEPDVMLGVSEYISGNPVALRKFKVRDLVDFMDCFYPVYKCTEATDP